MRRYEKRLTVVWCGSAATRFAGSRGGRQKMVYVAHSAHTATFYGPQLSLRSGNSAERNALPDVWI